MSTDDIRELENLDRVSAKDGGDLYLVNGNMMPLEMAGAAYERKEKDGGKVLELEESNKSENKPRRASPGT